MRLVRMIFPGLLLLVVMIPVGGCIRWYYSIPLSADEARAIRIARQAVAANDTWADRAIYEARRTRRGWAVCANRIQGYAFGVIPRFPIGGYVVVVIDKNWNVARIIPGK